MRFTFAIFLLVALVGLSCGFKLRRYRRQQPQPQNVIPIVSFVNENNYDGSYKYSYETGNGISVQEEGVLKNAGSENEAQSASGQYSFTTPEGQLVTVIWTSDETGFHPRVSYQSQG